MNEKRPYLQFEVMLPRADYSHLGMIRDVNLIRNIEKSEIQKDEKLHAAEVRINN